MDKRKARHNKWRIAEKNLFILAFAGGALGIYIAMNLFRHKTKKLKFIIGIPAIFIINIIIAYWLTQTFV
jgi:uncharacterized membrane protein YsdA (DUF1294 family)